MLIFNKKICAQNIVNFAQNIAQTMLKILLILMISNNYYVMNWHESGIIFAIYRIKTNTTFYHENKFLPQKFTLMGHIKWEWDTQSLKVKISG